MPWRARAFAEIVSPAPKPGFPDGVLFELPGGIFTPAPMMSLLGQNGSIEPAGGENFTLPPRRWLSLHDAGVLGDEGFVYSMRSRIAVLETAGHWHGPPERNPRLAAPCSALAIPLPGVSFSLLQRFSSSFYHFLIETLPRLSFPRPPHLKIDRYLVPEAARSHASRWLSFAGLSPESLHFVKPLDHFACEQLVFSNELVPWQQPTTWAVGAVRDVLHVPSPSLSASKATPGRAIFLTRKNAYERHLRWEDELLGTLPWLERIDPAGLEPTDQIKLFASADLIVAPHGAGLSNVVFCRPGTRVVELFPSFPILPLYTRLAHASGCECRWAVLNFSSPDQSLRLLTEALAALWMQPGTLHKQTGEKTATT